MFIMAIVFSVLALICGVAIFILILCDEDEGLVSCIIIFIIALATSPAFYCLHSPFASLVGGGLLTATTCIFIIFQYICFNEDLFGARVSVLIMGVANFICAVACYLNISDYFALGVSCSVIFGLALINIVAAPLEGYRGDWWGLHLVNAIFAVVSASGVVVGFVFNSFLEKEVRVETECAIYKYDHVNSLIADEAETELNFNEYYAMRVCFEWYDLVALITSSKNVQIKITFPAAVTSYIAEGTEFTKSDTNGTVWEYNFEINTKSDEQFKSGYFIFNYDYKSMDLPVEPFNVQINVLKDGTIDEDDKAFKGYKHDYKYVFNRRNYPFSSTDCVKDLSVADEGYYRIKIPQSCNSFAIKIYDESKSGLYYTEVVTVSGEYYRLEIPIILENNIEESVYNSLKDNKETLVIEITAVGNDNFNDTSIEVEYSLQ